MANCTKCENGMVAEVDGHEIFKWRCSCKTPEFWEQRRQEKAAWRDSVLRRHDKKVGA